MNHTTVFLSIGLTVVLCGPAVQAQDPSSVRSGSAGTDTASTRTHEAPVSDAQASDGPEALNTIRIVRLSQASGKVEMDRNIGRGFELAFNNLPVTQGARLKTSEGTAEVEFEDGTTLRMVPDTQVDFTQLSRTAANTTLSTLKVLKGTVYVSLNKTKGNTFDLTSGDGVIKPRLGAHLRLEVRDAESRLSVLTGTADFTNFSGSREVGKMKSLLFNTATPASADLIVGIEDAPFDNWDALQTEYHKSYSRGNALAGSGSTYGLADLNYYGSFSNVGGCGQIWRPYFTSAAWDPYGSGIWALSPGGGYSWVSPYPWGWAPFHYGSWLQCGGGWGWQPGGGWYGLGGFREPYRRPHDPPRPGDPIHVHPLPPRPQPVSGKARSMIAVNQGAPTFSHVDLATGSFNFRNDSAGLGVPRGEFGDLRKLSQAAGKAGSSNAPLAFIPPSRTELSSVRSDELARDERASERRVGDRAGFFNRPVRQGDGANGVSQGSKSSSTSAGYPGNHPQEGRGSNPGYSSSPHGGNASSGGYGRGSSANSSGYSGSSGGYSGGSGAGAHSSAPPPASPSPAAPVSAHSTPAPSSQSAHH